MPLLDKSLLDLLIIIKKYMVKDFWLISIQLIKRMEWIHSKNVIYQDVKPQNFLFGLKDPDVLYITDFGLCKKYRSDKSRKHICEKWFWKFTGTTAYASLHAMMGYEQSRKDDMESLGYLFIFLLKSFLP